VNRNDRNKNNEFVRNVLSRTSGSPCERACEQLPDLAGGNLGDMDRQLVQAHLEHCDGCRSVAVVLGWMQPLLPDMAELDPGPAFTRRVISRTTGAVHPLERAARRGETVGPLELVDRLARWWQKQIFRPRFAMEVAYVATVILVLLTSVPGAPFEHKAKQAGEMIQAGPRSMPVVGSLLISSEDHLDLLSSGINKRIGEQWQEIKDGFEQRVNDSGNDTRAAVDHFGQAWDHGQAGQLNLAGFEFKEAAKSTRLAWLLFWRGHQEANKPTNDS
jgi:Putative zinc-finger